MNLHNEINNIITNLKENINKGDCFHKEGSYEQYVFNIDRLKTLSAIQYTENQGEC